MRPAVIHGTFNLIILFLQFCFSGQKLSNRSIRRTDPDVRSLQRAVPGVRSLQRAVPDVRSLQRAVPNIRNNSSNQVKRDDNFRQPTTSGRSKRHKKRLRHRSIDYDMQLREGDGRRIRRRIGKKRREGRGWEGRGGEGRRAVRDIRILRDMAEDQTELMKTKQFLVQMLQSAMKDDEREFRHLTDPDIDKLLGIVHVNLSSTTTAPGKTTTAPGNNTMQVIGAGWGNNTQLKWRVELNPEQKVFVIIVVVIASLVALETLIFAMIWCMMDQEGFLPVGCKCCGTPDDTFSPQRWWTETLARRVEYLESRPLMSGQGRGDEPDPMPQSSKPKYKDRTSDGNIQDTTHFGP